MNTKSKILLVGSAVLGVVLLTGFRGGHMGWGARNPERIKQMITWRLDDRLEDLKATDDQKRTIQGLKDSLFDEGQKLVAEQREAGKELVNQWDAAQPDARAVHALVDARVDAGAPSPTRWPTPPWRPTASSPPPSASRCRPTPVNT
ncbi:Spy/CpxP family protein refolding chaperone [Cystobacter fuscus]